MGIKRSLPFLIISLSLLLFANFGWPNISDRPGSASQTPEPTPTLPFYIGMLEDGHLVGGNTEVFRSLIFDLQSRGLDAIMFTNNSSERDAPLLNISDELNFNVFMIPASDLNRDWWSEEVPATLETALAVADPIVKRWSPHPSLKGYLTKDEPRFHEIEKVRLINEAFRTLDPSRPAMPILIGANRVGPIFEAVQPRVMLIDVYPAGAPNELCDLSMTGFGYQDLDFVDYIRIVTQEKPASVPLWIILQTHSFLDQLREPIPAEVREQHWLAIGEGATGIFWFIYSSQQGWKGLVDNPALYKEVTSLTLRTLPLRETLLGLQKGEDQFTVSGTSVYAPYVSTLHSLENKYFAVVVNRDCQIAQDLTVQSSSLVGQLRDVETDRVFNLDSPITFQPGDGKIFELIPIDVDTPVPTGVLPTPSPCPRLE